MRWFKHLTGARHNEKMARLKSKHGMAGVGLFWSVVEIVGGVLDAKNHPQPTVSYPVSKWAAELQLHAPNVRKQLSAIASEGLLEMSSNGSEIRLTIPNLLKYRDEYQQKSGHAPDDVPHQNQNQIQNHKSEADPQTEIPDDSAPFAKPSERTPEFGLPSPPSKDGRNGLTPIGDLTSTVEDVQKLRAEMRAIRGQEPSQTAVVNVRTALGDCPVGGFVEHLRGIDSRYRPGGHRAVATWKWFESTAKSYAEAWAQAICPNSTDAPTRTGECRHGKQDGQCSQCLPRAEFEAGLDAF